jgi:hypothetical protein
MTPRRLLGADAIFEVALGLALIVGVASGGLGASDFPHPVGTVVVAVVGALLLGAALIIWRGIPLALLAAGNLATAAAAVVWLVVASGFSTAGSSCSS